MRSGWPVEAEAKPVGGAPSRARRDPDYPWRAPPPGPSGLRTEKKHYCSLVVMEGTSPRRRQVGRTDRLSLPGLPSLNQKAKPHSLLFSKPKDKAKAFPGKSAIGHQHICLKFAYRFPHQNPPNTLAFHFSKCWIYPLPLIQSQFLGPFLFSFPLSEILAYSTALFRLTLPWPLSPFCLNLLLSRGLSRGEEGLEEKNKRWSECPVSGELFGINSK